jgi:hypothetical protein
MAYAYQVAHLMLLLVVRGKIQMVRRNIQVGGAIVKWPLSDSLACTHAKALINIIGHTQIQMLEPTVKAFMTTTITMQIVVVVAKIMIMMIIIIMLMLMLMLLLVLVKRLP